MPNSIGQNWLLLRGLSREAGHWGEFLPLLQSRFPLAHIHTLDLPGTGQRYQETSPCSIKEITNSVRAQALKQGLLNQPLTILGLSLGGMVAWEWMLMYPEDICAAALINTSQASLSPFYHRLRWQSYPNFFKLITQPNRFKRELAVIRYVANNRDKDEQIAKEWEKIQAERPISFENSIRQIIAAARYRPENRKPTPPILLLKGRGDRLVAPACSEAIAKKWHLELHTHPRAGHDLALDDGAWVADRLQCWLEQLKNESSVI
jgi:pimeloyl-ACP methyl ester carboxylesterase